MNYLLFGLFCFAHTVSAANVVTPTVATYEIEEDFATVKENVLDSIINHGFTVSNTLHLSEMLNRTGKDLGYPQAVYQTAESIAFCSASISHKMTQLNPLNLAICPFTIAIYNQPDNPKQVHVAFRKPHLVGNDAEKLEQEIEVILETIVQEALDF